MIDALLLAAAQPAPAEPSAPDCSYDLDAMLALDRQAFDQAIPDGGWRGLSREGCHEEAADNTYTRPDGTVVKLGGPPNMNVLRNFEMCWGRSYKAAYGSSSCVPDEG